MEPGKKSGAIRTLLQGLFALFGAALITLVLFLFLPLMQAIGDAGPRDMIVRSVDTGNLPPPPCI